MADYRYATTGPDTGLWYHPDPVDGPPAYKLAELLRYLDTPVRALVDDARQATRRLVTAKLQAAQAAEPVQLVAGASGGRTVADAVLAHHLGAKASTWTVSAFALSDEAYRLRDGDPLERGDVHQWLDTFLRPPAANPANLIVPRAVAAADTVAASPLVAACESAWTAIQDRHPDVPDVVVVLGTGVDRGRLSKLGHFWAGQWVAGERVVGEVLLAGEALHLPAARVFEVLLHEAAHGRNAARGVKDTSRQGRYHNDHYRHAARELGLRVEPMPPYGWAKTTLTPETVGVFQPEIDRIADAMRIARTIDERTLKPGATAEGHVGGVTSKGSTSDDPRPPKGRLSAGCGCGRRLQMSPSVLAAGPVMCGVCDTEFVAPAVVERSSALGGGADSPWRREPDSVLATIARPRQVAGAEVDVVSVKLPDCP